MHRATAGDRDALDQLWRAHRRFAAAVLLAHLPKSVDLEDLLQDVAMKMVTQIETLSAAGSFRPWLRTVARNVAISHGRRARVRSATVSPLVDEPEDPQHQRAVDAAPIADELDAMLDLVRKLHPDYREPLLMRTEGCSQHEIAEALSLPETTIESRIARARRLVRSEAARAHGRPVRRVSGGTR